MSVCICVYLCAKQSIYLNNNGWYCIEINLVCPSVRLSVHSIVFYENSLSKSTRKMSLNGSHYYWKVNIIRYERCCYYCLSQAYPAHSAAVNSSRKRNSWLFFSFAIISTLTGTSRLLWGTFWDKIFKFFNFRVFFFCEFLIRIVLLLFN